ncbi:MAG: type IX secretion system membrane protein PorP/SprF [Bacteroidia bacterium]
MKQILTVVLIFCGLYAMAQQEPYYTHFRFNTESYNPASAGEHTGFICLTGVTHYQWRNFDDVTLSRGTDGDPGIPTIDNVAPETHNVNVSTLFKIDKAERNFIGAGLSIVDDNVGVTKATTIRLNLNYKRRLDRGFREIAVGAGIGMQQFGVVNPNFKFKDPNDPLIPSQSVNQGLKNINAGVFYKQQRLGPFKNFYAGASITQLTQENYNQLGTFYRQYVHHYFTVFGADYELNPTLKLEPAVLFKYGLTGQYSYVPQVDVSMTALYGEKFRGGVAVRNWANFDAASVLIGFVSGQLELGYSYDITLSSVQSVSAGTHEIMIKYCLPYSVAPPERIIRLTPRFL